MLDRWHPSDGVPLGVDELLLPPSDTFDYSELDERRLLDGGECRLLKSYALLYPTGIFTTPAK
jgi:hypothetical protein